MNSIAIIDSGIDVNFKEFRNKNIKGFNINTYESTLESVRDFNGHGTACAAEIFRQNPNANVNIIKVLDDNSQCSVKKLIEAIEYTSEIEDVKIISLSCSTFQNEYLDDFKKVIDYANKKDKLIVCSSDNTNKFSYPSYMSGVIGVQRSIESIDKYWFNSSFDIQCICKAEYRLLPSINKNYKLFGGNSYCTAYFCGLVSNIIQGSKSIENSKLIDIINNYADKTMWTVDDLDLNKVLKKKDEQKKYNYFKLKILMDLIGEFSNTIDKNIHITPIYNLIGLDNIYKFLKDLSKVTNESIQYSKVTNENLISVYSLYNLIFKD